MKINFLFYWILFSLFLLIACNKKDLVKIEDYKQFKDWLSVNGQVYKEGTLNKIGADGKIQQLNLDWANTSSYKIDGIDYTEVRFVNSNSGNDDLKSTTHIFNSSESDEILFSLVFRNRFGEIEGAVKLTDENSIFKQEGKDEQGSLEFYYDFNNDILNAWLYEKNTKVLRVLNKVVTDINNPQSLSTTKVLDVRCSSIFVQSRHYHCATNPFLNANGGLNMNASCGWVSGGFVEFKSCGRGGGPGSATGGGGGGGGSNGNSNWPSAKSPRQEDCSTFENRVGDVLNSEGAYTNDPDDPGGPTNKGISWNVWLSYAKEVVGVEPTLDNLKNITKDQAKQIYKTKYWDAIYADQVLDGDLRFLLFDFFVNSGANAVKVLQRTINDLGGLVSVDGQIGINTINAINSLNSVELYNTYKSNRQIYYNNIVKRIPKQAKYIKGWTNRVNQFVDKKTGNSSNVNCK